MDTLLVVAFLVGYTCSFGWRLTRHDGRAINEPAWVVPVVGGALPFLVVALLGSRIAETDERLSWLAVAVVLYLGWVAVSMMVILRRPQDGAGVFVHLAAGLPILVLLSVWWR